MRDRLTSHSIKPCNAVHGKVTENFCHPFIMDINPRSANVTK